MMRLTQKIKNKRGQAMTEFIIVLPPLLLMFFAVIYFGQAVVYKGKVNMAARYVSFVEARGNTATGLYEKFFEGAGPNNVSFYSHDDWGPQAMGLGWAAAIIASVPKDYTLPLYIAKKSSIQHQPAQMAQVSYKYDPPGWLSWIGSKTTAGALGVDADPWKISQDEALIVKAGYCLQYQWDFAIGSHREDVWWYLTGTDDQW